MAQTPPVEGNHNQQKNIKITITIVKHSKHHGSKAVYEVKICSASASFKMTTSSACWAGGCSCKGAWSEQQVDSVPHICHFIYIGTLRGQNSRFWFSSNVHLHCLSLSIYWFYAGDSDQYNNVDAFISISVLEWRHASFGCLLRSWEGRWKRSSSSYSSSSSPTSSSLPSSSSW